MDVRLIISASRSLILTFLLREREVTEIKVENRESCRIAGSIFKGRVKRIAKSLGGAFVDIGLEREAYLYLKGMGEDEESHHPPEVGSEVIVQVKREPMEDKGAKVTLRIGIPGRYLVYLPTSKRVFVSSKIENDEKRERLKELLESVLKDEGVIVRTSAVLASEGEILEDLEDLRKKWAEIKRRAKEIKLGMLYEEVPLYAQLVRNHWQEIEEIVVDDRDLWTELLAYIEKNFPELLSKVRYVKNISVFFKKYGLDKAMARLFAKYIWLKSGGYLVIEETEAMTVIDVNSGLGCGETLEENALKTNLEAAEEIAKQVKLRDLGGIIVIDFIDMKDKKHKEAIVKKLKELFADEGSSVHIYGITHLGLLEMTRRKETPSVTKLLSADCPYCKGKGFIKSPEIVLYEIEKDLGYFKGRYLELRINPMLKDKIEKLLEKTNLKEWVSIREECDVPIDYYEMFLAG